MIPSGEDWQIKEVFAAIEVSMPSYPIDVIASHP